MNETKIVCYFKSNELAELCKKGNDIMVKFKATYSPDASPAFEITAEVHNAGIAKSNLPAAKESIKGCPKPCL